MRVEASAFGPAGVSVIALCSMGGVCDDALVDLVGRVHDNLRTRILHIWFDSRHGVRLKIIILLLHSETIVDLLLSVVVEGADIVVILLIEESVAGQSDELDTVLRDRCLVVMDYRGGLRLGYRSY